MDFAAGKGPRRLAIARTLFDMRRQGLYLSREARGLPTATVAPGGKLIWDERFVIANVSSHAISVKAYKVTPSEPQADAAFEDVSSLPAQALAVALACRPFIVRQTAGEVRVTPYVAPFDRFLTKLDFAFAQVVARKWSLMGYPSPPLALIDGN
ncbi:hypothetical protein [Oryzifoliimicrobium ureilyticus]|uniref:hypothetical protein n=1 Tax=Oryzifoliimicrobium ureilyticus TaxID=3113724 RepID=UPI0030760937